MSTIMRINSAIWVDLLELAEAQQKISDRHLACGFKIA